MLYLVDNENMRNYSSNCINTLQNHSELGNSTSKEPRFCLTSIFLFQNIHLVSWFKLAGTHFKIIIT